ncbi:hypothetical protein WN982_08690 [Paraburkholderia sp. IMGN_8]|uniref:hypothetical protein n=1 Tax=Paraburkholderia sp. IMGN_8 TaxID=3136564 RepID=UPI003100ABCF
MRAEHSQPVLECIAGPAARPLHTVAPGGLRGNAPYCRAEPYRYLVTLCSASQFATIAGDYEALVPWPLDLA